MTEKADNNQSKPLSLKPREIEILRLASLGLHKREIGQRMGFSEKTIEHILSDEPSRGVFDKIGVSNLAQAIAWYAASFGYPDQEAPREGQDDLQEPTQLFTRLHQQIQLYSHKEQYATVWQLWRPEVEKALRTHTFYVKDSEEGLRQAIDLRRQLGDTARTLGLTWYADKYYRDALKGIRHYQNKFPFDEAILLRQWHTIEMQSSNFYMRIPALARAKGSRAIRDLEEHLAVMERWEKRVSPKYQRQFSGHILWVRLREHALSADSLDETRVLLDAFQQEVDVADSKSGKVSKLCGLIRGATGMERFLLGLDRPESVQYASAEMRLLSRKTYDTLEAMLSSREISDLNRVRGYKAMAMFAFMEKDQTQVKTLLEKARLLAGQRLFSHQLSEVEWLYQGLVIARQNLS